MKVDAVRTGLILIFAAGLLARAVVSQNGPGETAEAGAIVRGQAIFEDQGKCLTCHFVANHGSLVGTGLTEIGLKLTPLQLRDALVHPQPEVQAQNQLYSVVTRDGTVHTGKLLNQDHFSLQMLDATGRLMAFKRDSLRASHPVQPAPMPSYQDKLTGRQLDDLIAFLTSLRGVTPQ
jgi:quinoprotein glucose dehydrogenase